jgi:pimeloyl-ACP methyl ester carboxylesterase
VDTEEIAFPGAGVHLSGSITCPDAAGACPGVVLVGGSGPSDRRNGGFFDALRTHLAGGGVAVLAYDKRGAGKSTGAWAAATVDDLAYDAAAAVAALQAHPRVTGEAVGVLGHSEGGWVALRLCARLDTSRHLIMNSCPAVSFAESEVFALTTAGAEPEAAAALLQQLAAAARAGRGYQQGRQIIATYQHEPWYPLLTGGGFTLDSTTWAQLTAWADYDPGDDLTRLKTPTLAIFGENDPLVPVRASVERYQETAARIGRYQKTLVFPGAGHRLQVTAGFAPGYLTQLSTWCHDQGTSSRQG